MFLESPTDQPEGDDPFDTSIAERAILGPVSERKGKKLLPLGSAVEVLTGRVQAPTCATKRPASRRQLHQENLLLENFEDKPFEVAQDNSLPKPSLLDDDAPPISEPIDLTRNLHIVTPNENKPFQARRDSGKNILDEFDVISRPEEPVEEDDEFALLAVESLTRAPGTVAVGSVVDVIPLTVAVEENWKPFGDE